MTDPTPSDDPADDQPAEQSDEPEDERPLEDVPAAAHRLLADAGVRLNEAQTHLSAVRTQETRSDLSGEVALAEAQALVRSLEESRAQIDEALAIAAELTPADGDNDKGEPPEADDDHSEETGDEDRGDDHDGAGPSMLWNTLHTDRPYEGR